MEDADYFDDLWRFSQHFQTAQGINHSLGKLYELLARNKISPRRAAVLSYITSLLLHTLPQIDKDNAAGMRSRPTEPPSLSKTAIPIAPSNPNSHADVHAHTNPAPDSVNASSS